MTDAIDSSLQPYQRVEDVARILDAMRQAVRQALLQHKQAGNPVAVWQDGQVVWVQPEDIPSTFDDEPPRE